ncbi:hypothetical protein [Roseovarius sp. MMSF_3305]|nr:hypothetical protein [Roseovarius sp. MMSF_3305]
MKKSTVIWRVWGVFGLAASLAAGADRYMSNWCEYRPGSSG